MEERQYRRGVVAGSFDPVHNGHLRLIKEARRKCDELIVVVASNPAKKYLFSAAKRSELLKATIGDLTGVRIEIYDGLLADFVLRHGCDAVIRGIRNEDDYRYEKEQERLTRTYVNPLFGATYEYLPGERFERDISSSLLKFMVSQGIVNPSFAPSVIYAALELQLRRVCTVGVIGGIATGKSTLTRALADQLRYLLAGVLNVHVISFDELLHRVYDDPAPGPQQLREKLRERFGSEVLIPDGTRVDRAALRARLFGNQDREQRGKDLEFVQECTAGYVMASYRETLRGLTGLVFVEMAQMLELRSENLVCERVINVVSSTADQNANERGIDPQELKVIREIQSAREVRLQALRDKTHAQKYGFVLTLENDRAVDLSTQVTRLLPQLEEQLLREWTALKQLANP